MSYKFMNFEKTDNKKDLKFVDFIKFAVITILIVVPIRMYVAQPFIVNGASMSPTFETGQYLIVDQFTYHFGEPQRGDVVIFKFPQDTSKFFIKRVVGLPGERVVIDAGIVTIVKEDGSEEVVLNEPYIEFKRNSYSETQLDEDEYYVMGDNREASLDSRIWGPLDKKYIVGRAYTRLLPVGEIDFMPGKFDFNI